jgi:hypothetical protein
MGHTVMPLTCADQNRQREQTGGGILARIKFRVSGEIVHRIFDEKFGGIANFADEWMDVSGDGDKADEAERSVKTIYAWLKHGLPTTKDTLFKFCGALDADPMAALDFDREDIRRGFGRLRRSFMLGGINAGGFRPLFDLYRPSPGWPEKGLARNHYGRDWTVFGFGNDATDVKNTYVTVRVSASDDLPASWPRAYHIAYRRKSNVDGLWRPYGSIISRQGEGILVHENGDIQRTPLPARSRHQLSFQTYFGPSPVEFRLASLHAFDGRVDPFPDPDVPLQFVG